MSEKRSGGAGRAVLWLVVLAVGFGAGWYARGRNQEDVIQKAVARAEADLKDAVGRGKRAGAQLKEGARAAGEGTKAAVRELTEKQQPTEKQQRTE